MSVIYNFSPRRGRRWLSAWALLALIFGTGLGLSACGGGGDTDTTAADSGSGEVVVALTDAEGDFATYTVDVVSLTLTKANGVVVETLPLNTRVDFAQYTEMTEFLTAATIPSGIYVKGSLVLDYSNADIWVENAAGDAVQVDTLVDTDGTPLTTLAVSVRLEGRNQLPIAPGIPAHLTLDFDLKASNTVSFDAQGVPSATVEPFLLAEVEAEHNKTHRLRGPLKQVDVAASKFQVYMRPFRHRIAEHQRHFGVLNVFTDNETVYEIDGINYQGEAGLAALELTQQFTGVIVIGDIHRQPRRFRATQVYAGSSVPGGDLDVVKGSVMARSGNTLTVRGATLQRTDGSAIFNDAVTVQLADSTTVSKQLSMEPAASSDISIGQRVAVFGTLTNTDIDALELDAANGHVRMELSSVHGSRAAALVDAQFPFVVNVTSINGRNADLYDFTGSGTDAVNDADPASYEINTGVLDVSAIVTGTPVAVRGHVTAFGRAPADFDAWTVVDLSAISSP